MMQLWCYILMLISMPTYASSFSCEQTFPSEIQLDILENCNQTQLTMDASLEPNYPEFDAILMDLVFSHHNLGGSVVHFKKNLHKKVYRSAILSAAPLCLYELIKKHDVSTIINLYDNKHAHSDELITLEKKIFQANGGEYYIQIFNFKISNQGEEQAFSAVATPISDDSLVGSRTGEDSEFRDKAAKRRRVGTTLNAEDPDVFNKKITTILRYIQAQEGNVLIHCLAGQHLTGVIFGVLQKCYNKLPLTVIKKNAECHMGVPLSRYAQKAHDKTLALIDAFPCPN